MNVSAEVAFVVPAFKVSINKLPVDTAVFPLVANAFVALMETLTAPARDLLLASVSEAEKEGALF